MIERGGTAPTARADEPGHRDAGLDPGHRRPGPADAGWSEPTCEFFRGRDGLPLTGWLYRPPARSGRARRCSACTAVRRPRNALPSPRSTRPWSRRASPSSRPTSAARPVSAGPSSTSTTFTADGTPSTTYWPAGTSWSVWGSPTPSGSRSTGRSYGGYLTLATPGLLPRRVRRRGRHLRHVRPAHLLPRHRAVDRRRGVQQVRSPRGGPRCCCRPYRRCGGRTTSTSRCWSCTASWTPTSRSARRTRSSPRCGSGTGRWSTWSWPGRATSTAGPTPG